MAKKIKFPLERKNKRPINTSIEFRGHFDINKILENKKFIYENSKKEKILLRPIARNEKVYIEYTDPKYRKKILKYYYKNILIKGKYTIFLLENTVFYSSGSGSGGSGSGGSNSGFCGLCGYGLNLI